MYLLRARRQYPAGMNSPVRQTAFPGFGRGGGLSLHPCASATPLPASEETAPETPGLMTLNVMSPWASASRDPPHRSNSPWPPQTPRPAKARSLLGPTPPRPALVPSSFGRRQLRSVPGCLDRVEELHGAQVPLGSRAGKPPWAYSTWPGRAEPSQLPAGGLLLGQRSQPISK